MPRVRTVDDARAQARDERAKGPDVYDFLPPATARAVVAFERRWRVTLPDEMRAFLLEVSAGGRDTRLGPPHLMTLADGARVTKRERARPDAPFPLGAADARRLLREKSKRKRDEDTPAIARDVRDGVLPLMDLGGGELNLIVVTGEERGNVWAAWERGWTPVASGFFQWLEGIFG
jgi:hypothetical protein